MLDDQYQLGNKQIPFVRKNISKLLSLQDSKPKRACYTNF
jgi:hypothetical protein